MMPFKKNLPAAGSGFSDYYVPEEKFLGPPSPKNLATPLVQPFSLQPLLSDPLPLILTILIRLRLIRLELNNNIDKSVD